MSLNSVFSQNDNEFFVIPEDEFFNPEDYSSKSTLSSDECNSSEKFRSENEPYNTNQKKIDGSINFTDFNFALAGDWGCTKNTSKLWI
jgi:hypothetical protein